MIRISTSKLSICLIAFLCLSGSIRAKSFMGEYKGTFYADSRVQMKATAKVVDEGRGRHRIVLQAKADDPALEGAYVEIYGDVNDQQVEISGQAGGYDWHGQIKDGRLSASSHYGQHFELDWFESKSPNAGMKPPAGAVILLPLKEDSSPDISGWTNQNWKALEGGVMQVTKGTNRTKRQFGDIEHFHVEFKLPLEPLKRGQGRANSGVYLLDRYEVQVLDSFGLTHTSGDCGGLYNLARAKVNASLPPETWQTYDITFRAARMDANGKVTELPQVTVIHNGVKIHDKQEIPGSNHRTEGPIQLQDHGHPIQFRNMWIVEGR